MEQNRHVKLENIQALRFVAAAMVLLTHITFYVNARIDSRFTIWHPGAAGVSLFFVISGIVIYLSSAALPQSHRSALTFLHRRVQRIVPLYWLITTLKVVLAFALPAALIKNQATVFYVVGSYFLFPVRNAVGNMEPVHGVGWTLIHEMFFYYVFAIGLAFRMRPVLFSATLISALCVLGFIFEPSNALLMVIFSEQNLLFVVGMMLAHAYVKGIKLPTAASLMLIVIGLISMLYNPVRDILYLFFHRFDIGAVLVITGSLTLRIQVAKSLQRMLAWLGDGSYSVYLIHPLLAPAIIAVMSKIYLFPLPLLVGMTWCMCVFVGQLVFLYVEAPLNFKFRIFTDPNFKKRHAIDSQAAATHR